MAQDIIPITLALTAGDLVTLWAPRWRQDGEEWEAFLGDDDALFAFGDAADLERAAADGVKRVLPRPASEPDPTREPDLTRLRAWTEIKTVWHPVGR